VGIGNIRGYHAHALIIHAFLRHYNPPEIVSCPPRMIKSALRLKQEISRKLEYAINIPNYSGSGFRTSNAKGLPIRTFAFRQPFRNRENTLSGHGVTSVRYKRGGAS
jgi:hypothetical protein